MINDQYFQDIFNNAGTGLVVIDDAYKILNINSEALNIFGYNIKELDNKYFFTLICSKGKQKILNKLNENSFQLFTNGINKQNLYFPIEIIVTKTLFNERIIFTIVLKNITEIKRNENKLKHQAYFDILTEIPNRTLLIDRSEIALNQAKRTKEMLAIIFIDLDGFKQLNDKFGHSSGDEMLKTFSKRLQSCARKSDTVARWGGDEFVILMPRIETIQDVIKLADRIIAVNKNPITIKTNLFYQKTSIGISLFPDDGDNFNNLINNADKAMYKSKKSGKNKFTFYNL